jgi:DNA-3-methyladenine glycosylase I
VYLRTASAHPWLAAWYARRGYAPGASASGTCDLRLERDLAAAWEPTARTRCAWAAREARMAAYHDFEWGLWVDGARDLFERLTLEVFQTGLSWRTVLVKRAALRRGLLGFEPARLAAATDEDEARFLETAGVIRSPRKFRATVANARALGALGGADGLLAAYLRSLPPERLYEDLRPRLRFFGPTVAESFFQSTGLVRAPHDDACDAVDGFMPVP